MDAKCSHTNKFYKIDKQSTVFCWKWDDANFFEILNYKQKNGCKIHYKVYWITEKYLYILFSHMFSYTHINKIKKFS